MKRETFQMGGTVPRPAGAYWVGGQDNGVAFTLTRRPAWWHRTMMRVAFGWVWVDEPNKLGRAPRA